MPSLLSPNTSSSSRSYTPLADEVNPPFGNHAPTVTRNGTVVYGNVKRVSSVGSDGQSSSSASGLQRSDSEETLSQSTNGRFVSRVAPEMLQPPDEEGDLGELRRSSAAAKGKGKEKAWDEEMGREEIVADSYPPINSVEEDERRIQDVSVTYALQHRLMDRISQSLLLEIWQGGGQRDCPDKCPLRRSLPRRRLRPLPLLSCGDLFPSLALHQMAENRTAPWG